MAITLTWVDAFTDKAFAGNQAGVCLLEEPLPDARMQSLAAELGISETAFVVLTAADGTAAAADDGSNGSNGSGGFDLRWFSPQVEIDLCGHATLASAHAMRQHGVVDGTTPVTFHTRSGPLVAAFDGDLIALDFPADPPVEGPLPDALGGQWAEGTVVDAGRSGFFAVVVLADEAAVRAYRPDLAAIAATGTRAVVLTAAADAGSGADYVLRVFGPNVGIDEDPATGSAQCVIGPYWAGVLGRPALVAHQVSPRGAVLFVRPDGDRVHIAGHAVTVFDGILC
jgi:PhzF family phenazine biosynthesis protein